MHSFIRTYPSLASAASGSAASSSNISRLGEEDENGSICCDIYIDGEDTSQIQKGGSSTSSKPLHVAAVLRGRGIPPEQAPEPEKRRICSCWRLTLIMAAIVVGAIVLGVSVGVSRAKKHQQHAGVPFGPGSPGSLSSSVTITVPFAASEHIDIPPGGLSCDALFGDEQALERFVDKLESAHARKMAQYQVDEVVVTELQCNNFSYPVPAETFLTGKPASASSAQALTAAGGLPPQGHHRRRRLASTQHQAAATQAAAATVQQQTYKLANGISSAAADGAYGSEEFLLGSSSSSGGHHKQLLVYVELEAKHREQLEKVPVISSHLDWIQRVSKAGAALAGQLVVELLSAEFSLDPGSCATDSVQQLNVEVISSQMVYDDILSPVTQAHSGRKGYKGSTVVTRTEIDPLTGRVTESQTMRLPVLPDYLPELLPDLGPITGGSGQDGSGATAAAPAPAPGPATTPSDSSQPAQASPQQHAPTAPTCEGEGEGEGVCGLPNTASSACVAGACRVVACAPGWEDCDGNPQNGCEANVLGFFIDDNHCGSCNKVCLSPLKCQLGKCAVRPPAPATPTLPTEEYEDYEEDEAVTEEPTGQQQPSTQQPAQGGEGTAGTPGSGQTGEQQQQPKPETPSQGSEQKPKPEEEPSSTVPTPPPVGPSEPQAPTDPTQKPEPATPGVPATKPETPPAFKPHPKPHKPGKPLPRHISLHDDVARISPSQPDLILDVISNDDLRGADPSTATLSVLAQPSVGTVSVLPPSGPHTHPRLLYKQGKDRLEPGSEVEVFYTVKVPGHPQPAPGTALLLGAVTPSDSSLSDCSAAAGATVRGAPIPGLTRADDAAVTVKLPFPVRLHGAPYSHATISSNGWVSLGEATGAKEPCNVEGSWPNAACLGAGPVLAPFWDDLVVDQVLTHYNTNLDAYVIQWTNAMAPAAKLPIGTFQAWIFANGTVGYVYRDLYGIEQALGSSAVAGIRGPAVKAKPYVTKLMSKAFESVGSGSDEHGSWLFSAALDETSDYATLLGIHRRFLNPGMAVISHPVPPTGTPSKFKPWSAGSSAGLWPLLVSPDAPAQPALQQLVLAPAPAAAAAAAVEAGAPGVTVSSNKVVTLTWDFPGESSHTPLSPTFYKLYLAADPYFNELLRQPASPAFKPDIPPNTRSVDVELNAGHTHNEVYALLLACNSHACSRSCIDRYSLK